MNADEFRKFGKAAVDYVADYLDNIRERSVLSNVEPGYLQRLLPQEAPTSGESWQNVLQDVDNAIMPGLTHWHSPNFHAYYPTANSYPGIVGELFLSGLGIISKDWSSSPAALELEIKMMDWLGRLINLPEEFLNSSQGPGGGVLQNAASESTLVGLLSGKNRTLDHILKENTHLSKQDIEGKLVAYTSEQSNSSVEKAGLLASVPMKLLATDNEGSLRGDTLLKAVLQDKQAGLVPCCVIATLGTTGTCAFDKLDEIGAICQQYGIWLHVDAAYAGSAFACPEYQHLMWGIEHVDSFNINPHKWMLVNSDCSAMWFKDATHVQKTFKVGDNSSPEDIPDIQHWQIPDSRRFRALKLWFVMRIYGVSGIQKHIRHQIYLADYFAELIRSDDRFEVCTASMGLVCFRLKGDGHGTQRIIDRVTEKRNIFVMPYYCQNQLAIRFVICSRFTEQRDVLYAWNEIKNEAENVVSSNPVKMEAYTATGNLIKENHINVIKKP